MSYLSIEKIKSFTPENVKTRIDKIKEYIEYYLIYEINRTIKKINKINNIIKYSKNKTIFDKMNEYLDYYSNKKQEIYNEKIKNVENILEPSNYSTEEKNLIRNICFFLEIKYPTFIENDASIIKYDRKKALPSYIEGKTFYKETIWKLDDLNNDTYTKKEGYYYLEHFFVEYKELLSTNSSYIFYYLNLINFSKSLILLTKNMDEPYTKYLELLSKKIEIFNSLFDALKECNLYSVYKFYFKYLDYYHFL